jgi:hypothetical protein
MVLAGRPLSRGVERYGYVPTALLIDALVLHSVLT